MIEIECGNIEKTSGSLTTTFRGRKVIQQRWCGERSWR